MTSNPPGPATGSSPTGSVPAGSAPTGSAPAGSVADRPPAAWPIVAVREIVVKLTDRNFLISTASTLLIIVAALVFQGMMASRSSTASVAVVDPQAQRIVELAAATPSAGPGGSVTVTAVPRTDDAAARAALRDGSADAYLHQGTGGWTLTTKDSPQESVAAALAGVVREQALERNAAAANTSLEALQRGSQLQTDQLDSSGDRQESFVRIIAGLVFAMLFYLASLLFGMSIAQSVVEEKQSRIVEILATAIPVRQLLIGKVLGNTLLALAQMVLFVAAALIGVLFTPYKSYLPSLSAPAMWYLAFFVAGFVTLACVWAVAGSLSSRVEDLQSSTMPLTILLVVALVAGLSATGSAQVITSYVPLLSTITMPLRLLAGEAAWWEPVVSLLITLVAAALIIRVAEKVYRRSLLQSQGRMSFRQALAVQD